MTNAGGQFAYTAGAAMPIASGPFVVSVAKTGYRPYSSPPHTLTPGTNITGLTLLVMPIAAAAPSASATLPTSASASPGVSESSPHSTAGTATQNLDAQIGAGTDGGGSAGGPLGLPLVAGIVLLVAAAGVIAYVARRRRQDRRYAVAVSSSPDGGDTQHLPAVPAWRQPRTPWPVHTPQP